MTYLDWFTKTDDFVPYLRYSKCGTACIFPIIIEVLLNRYRVKFLEGYPQFYFNSCVKKEVADLANVILEWRPLSILFYTMVVDIAKYVLQYDQKQQHRDVTQVNVKLSAESIFICFRLYIVFSVLKV